MRIIEKSAEFIKKGELELIGYNQNKITVQVKEHLVTFQKKAGRVDDSCSCQNHARFCKENPRCSHKLAAATFIVMRRLKWK
ncbi:MAG: hypothetical protein ACTSQY_09685 [Candidatus Odinarchaeia archaeon]